VAALLGLSMCRLAALSDENHAAALAEWVATIYRAEREAAAADRPAGKPTFDRRGDAFRAAG
jgi:hypothetical protein